MLNSGDVAAVGLFIRGTTEITDIAFMQRFAKFFLHPFFVSRLFVISVGGLFKQSLAVWAEI